MVKKKNLRERKVMKEILSGNGDAEVKMKSILQNKLYDSNKSQLINEILPIL